MPIISNFPGGSGSGGGGLVLAAVTNLNTLAASGKVYIKWTDPDDIVVSDSTLASWSGTLLVRKAGSMPTNRRDGTIILDSKTRNEYSSTYFCDSGLTNGTTYYYKLFPYTTANAYTDDTADEFSATPTVQVAGIDSWNVSSMATAAAGDGKMTVKWTDPAATITSDGVTLATWASTTIVVKAGSYPTSIDDADAAYTLKVTTRNQYSSSALTISGLTNGTTYYIQFFPETTDGGVNTSTANRTTGVANRITISNTPSQSGTLTYTGSAQSPTWSNYSTTQLTLGGTTSGTNAGNYSATFTPKTDYMWSDGTTTAKTISWTIAKATGSLSISPTSLTLNMNATSGTISVTRLGDGTITATSSNTSVATVSVSGTTVTVNNVNQTNGSATITVSVAAGTNYTAPSSKTCSVTASFVSTTLNDNTWAVIKSVSDAGQGANYWSVGATKTITINGTIGATSISSLSIDVFILGFDHNSAKEGTNRIHFQIGKISGTMVGLVDSGYGTATASSTAFNMNTSNTNSGGWNSSLMRATILGNSNTPTSPLSNSFMAALPSDLRAVMKSVTKYTDNTANGGGNVDSYVTATTDYLFLLSEFEVQGARTYANSYEQNYQLQYDYYKNGNSKIAYRHSATTTTARWWLRSPHYTGTTTFCSTNTDGTAYASYAGLSYALAPGFTV